ncbi:fibronectin type III domain-containing protein [Paractinoplanes toevensis]|uniref:fibronectin type III domain-containing protein n=1 Tax=Paractinoplanes toevensis TaxID=571911 RepID=UPI001BB34170|nr:fibronectin type III domain-containing protein [Actinoplanes toevensis]
MLTNPGPAAAAPGSPTGVTAVAGRRTITVSWTAPAGGGVNHYRAVAGGESCETGGISCTISNLTANTAYVASVAACATADSSNCSSAVNAASVTPGPPATPLQPTVTYTKDDQTTMSVSWVPNDPGGIVTAYRVTPSTTSGLTGPCLGLVSGTSCDVAGLTPGQSYTFKLTAIGTGATGSSAVGPASTPKYVGVPVTPDAPTITRVSNSAVTVSWTKPTGNAAISGYTVQKSTGGAPSNACATTSADATECQVTGLDETQSYTFTVRANGEGTYGGSSGFSSTSAAIIPGKPNKPDAPTVELGAEAGQVTVNWTAPEGGAVTGYTVTPASIVDNTPPSPCETAATVIHCDFSGLDDGVAYTFRVVAKGAVNSDPSDPSDSIVSQLPTKPATPVAALVADSPGTVELTWDKPVTGGPVIYYTVTVSSTTGGALLGEKSAGCGFNLDVPSCTITGLTPEASYTFTVTAIGDLGSVTSDPSAAFTPNKPAAPATAVVTRDGVDAATVTWTPPAASGGGVVETYTATATPADGAPATVACDEVPANTLSCPFTSLDAAGSYTFTVTAANAAGHSADATATVAVPDIPSAAETPVVVLGTAPGEVDVNWSLPAQGTATRYIVTAHSADGGTLPAACEVAALTCPITGLTAAKHYTFTVRAENFLGGTDASPTSPAVLPDRPGTPTSVDLTVTAVGEATLTWAAPAAGGEVASYTATATDDLNNSATPCTAVSSSTTSCAFTLDPARAYTFAVIASNNAGDSDPATVGPITADKPGAPGGVAAVLGNVPGKVVVTWTAPTGVAVTGYTVTPASSDGTAPIPTTCDNLPGTQLSCTYTGLKTTAPYTFTVAAENAVDSTAASATPALIPDEPGPPRNVTAARGNVPKKVTVTWDAPNSGGETATYTVTATPTDGTPAVVGCDKQVAGDPTTCVFTDLTATRSYLFTVTASNNAGDNDEATTTGLMPNEPDKPTGVKVEVNGPGSVTVTWNAPTGANLTTGWVVTPATSDGATPNPATCPVAASAARTCTFTGLTTTARYTFVVRASNEAGDTDSDPTNEVVANKPGAPGAPVTIITGDETVRLFWTPPVLGGPVTGYSVTAYTAGQPDTPITSAACTDLEVPTVTCEFDGLSMSELYTFRVTTSGPGGDVQGDRSMPVSTERPGEPAPPTVELSGPGAVRVSWDPPEVGGPVLGYSVVSTPDMSAPARCTNVNAMTTTCVFDRLRRGRTYTFRVLANGTADRSTSSGASQPILVPAVAPGKPAAPVVRVLAPDKVRLAWTAPVGAGVVSRYAVAAYTDKEPDTAITSGTCTDLTTLTCDFGELKPDETYTFRVTATGPGGDVEGDPSATVTTAAPGKPAAPTVTLIGPDAVRVTWTEPTGGGQIISYSVTSQPDVSPPARCTTVNALTCDFDRLHGGTAYTFTVTANGTANRSTVSDASETVVVPSPAATPAAPAVALTDETGTVTVSWTAPGTGGSITGYEVRSTPGFRGCAVPPGPGVTSCSVPGLDPGTTYTFRVRALGVNGQDSEFGPASKAIVPGAPSAPELVVAAAGNRQVDASWTPSADSSRVDHYRATATPGGKYCETTGIECAIDGLDNLMVYTITVTAVTKEGISSTPSAPSGRVRPTAGRPGSPTAVTAAIGDAGTVVKWTAPVTVGDGIARYVATAVDATGASRQSCSTPDGTTTTCPITGLTNGTTYTVTVVSVGRGASGYSEPATADRTVTPKAVPPVPTGVTVTSIAKGLTVSWKPGTATGGDAVAGFTATADGGTAPATCSGSSATSTSCTISGLTPGSYSVTVVARGVTAGFVSKPSSPVDATALTAVAPVPGTSLPTSAGVLTVAPGTVKAGGAVTISGSGFAPYTAIAVAIYSPRVTVPAVVVTDSKGAFTQEVTIPAGVAIGTRAIVAGGQTSATNTAVRYLTAPLTVS